MAGGRLWVAMSGGVDSSVAAALSVAGDYDVTGVTLDLGRGQPDAVACNAAARVCSRLGIEHSVIDVAGEFRVRVVEYTASEYALGRTPNP